ncbi:MAG: hypothetical protein SW019_04485 [Actinomycetota bacterium]|nr:hypothetical protein [Actinomycetota bacterium]
MSVTSGAFGWVLVDADEGTVLDHDVLEFAADAHTAVTAVRGAHAIATTAGLQIDRVRLAWTDDAAVDGLRLLGRLQSLEWAPVEAIPHSCALSAAPPPGDADIPGLAYGAATVVVDPSEAITEPVAQRPVRPARPRRLMSTALGVAAAITLGVLCLGAAGAPEIAPAATSVEQPPAADPGWVAVPVAPANPVATPARKVVDLRSPQTTSPSAPTYYPVQTYTAPAPTAAPPVVTPPAPAALPVELGEQPAAAGQPHLSEPAPAAAPVAVPHATDPLAPPAPGPQLAQAPAPAPDTQMTDPLNLFTALP